jgi:hypothetical protein
MRRPSSSRDQVAKWYPRSPCCLFNTPLIKVTYQILLLFLKLAIFIRFDSFAPFTTELPSLSTRLPRKAYLQFRAIPMPLSCRCPGQMRFPASWTRYMDEEGICSLRPPYGPRLSSYYVAGVVHISPPTPSIFLCSLEHIMTHKSWFLLSVG